MTRPSVNNAFMQKGWSVNPSNNWWHLGTLYGTATFFARTSGQYTWAILIIKELLRTMPINSGRSLTLYLELYQRNP